MDDEFKELIKKNLEVSEKMLQVLKKMRHAELMRSIFSTTKWVIIIGLTVFSFIQFQPYINSLFKTYQTLLNTTQQFNKVLPK